ncbi:ATP-dependent Clp protease proteolytic subunit [Methylomonas sp. AM2-LC]|uniref:ATP-dependent Clp protease proteolytic subunit n=1 Tax=Methylomonas sp. AM2-LC TaxID=3153301 RepID=UPI003265461F
MESEQVKNKKKIKQPPVLFAKTQTLIKNISNELGSPVISYWNNPRGSVCANDVIALNALLEKLGHNETLYFFIKSDGGNGQASLRMVNLLRQYCTRLVALVPHECASAATMIAIGADQILMGPTAFLTAVDTSLNHSLSPVDRDNARVSVSLDELNRVVKRWQSQAGQNSTNPYASIFEYIHPLVVGAVDRAESLSIMLCKEILFYHIKDKEKALEIATTLNSKYPSHSYPILMDEAKEIGLNVGSLPRKINSMLLNLNILYSEMGQKAITDHSEILSHGNEILNIHETNGVQLFYQNDKDWFYRTEERRWITMNDESSWRIVENIDGKIKKSILHIS